MQEPPDTSICDKEKKNKWGFDMKKFAYMLNPAKTNPRTFDNLFKGYKKKRDTGDTDEEQIIMERSEEITQSEEEVKRTVERTTQKL